VRWVDLFNVRYEVLLYDLTSTYFECDVPDDPNDPRRFGHSRDRRGDCVQVVVALVVTPEGRLTRMEGALAETPWMSAREKVRVKLHEDEGELYVLAESGPRKDKERALRQRKLKRYWKRLADLKAQLLDRPMSRDDLIEKIGAAKDRAGRQAAALASVVVAAATNRFREARDRADARRTDPHHGWTRVAADSPHRTLSGCQPVAQCP